MNSQSSIRPSIGSSKVGGDGAPYGFATGAVRAHCRVAGSPDLYYYSTTFAGGPGSAGSTPLLSDPDSNSTLIHSSSNLPVDLGLIKQSQDIASPRPRQYQQKAQQAPFDLPLTPPNSTPGSSPERPDNRHNHQQHATQPMNILKTSKKVVNGFTISFKEPSNPLETPPATPQTNAAGAWVEQANPALAFLRKIFKPHGPREALSFATSVTINTQEGVTWEGIVLSLPGKSKTLYVDGKGAENVQLRESIVALLDLAGEHLDCEAFVIALERQTPALAGLIHSLLYVSGTVVTRPPFEVADNYVLVGIDM
ncbi:hypothetical protein FRB96_008792 [Tulasnella sp. 330]|nr:hypothetical protein FRB96_008792 [Tulasnella sp. 330]KAG8884148.1 hypothetical protein FRB97_005131 [Tulasnella sp. 331]KAG8890176.1 hypothetical protein FRB98_000504 [Tulasnella sp. 332]